MLSDELGGPISKKDRYIQIPDAGRRIYRDVYSNIHYGYVGKQIFTEGVAEIGNVVGGGTEDAGDRVSRRIGYELAGRYPGGHVPYGAVTDAIRAHLAEYGDKIWHE